MVLEAGIEDVSPTSSNHHIVIPGNIGDYNMFEVEYRTSGSDVGISLEHGVASDVIMDLQRLMDCNVVSEAVIKGRYLETDGSYSILPDGTRISHVHGRLFDRQRNLISNGLLEDPNLRLHGQMLTCIAEKMCGGDRDKAALCLCDAFLRTEQDLLEHFNCDDLVRHNRDLVSRAINLNLIEDVSS